VLNDTQYLQSENNQTGVRQPTESQDQHFIAIKNVDDKHLQCAEPENK